MNPAAIIAAANGDTVNMLVAACGGIEAQEKAGQQHLIENSELPKQLIGATREYLVSLGFQFGKDIDELFVECKLPPGWTKQATNHSMHSDLIDDKGRIRFGIFYKAAFYDRRADMRIMPRYSIDAYYESSKKEHFSCVVLDGATVIFKAGDRPRDDYKKSEKLRIICENWLTDHFPLWEDSRAYW